MLYLLHGAHSHFADWNAKTLNKALIHRLADQCIPVIVMNEAEKYSCHFYSLVNKASQFAVSVTGEATGMIGQTFVA